MSQLREIVAGVLRAMLSSIRAATGHPDVDVQLATLKYERYKDASSGTWHGGRGVDWPKVRVRFDVGIQQEGIDRDLWSTVVAETVSPMPRSLQEEWIFSALSLHNQQKYPAAVVASATAAEICLGDLLIWKRIQQDGETFEAASRQVRDLFVSKVTNELKESGLLTRDRAGSARWLANLRNCLVHRRRPNATADESRKAILTARELREIRDGTVGSDQLG